MRKSLSLFGLAVLAVLLSAGVARASEPQEIGRFSDWYAYAFEENGNKVCYMASRPQKAEGNYTRRGEIFALVTHRPAEGSKNVFSYMTGYAYKSGSDATVKIGSQKFTLFTQDETAWAPDAESDEKLFKAIRKGSEMVVTGVSSRGTKTTDTFSLKGSGAAQDAINKACNVK